MTNNNEKNEQENSEKNVFGLTSQQMFELSKEARDKFFSTKKVWRQRGFWLVCTNCPHDTAIWLGPDKIMVGEDENGKPILENK